MAPSQSSDSITYLSDAYRDISYFDTEGPDWRVNFAGLHRMILASLQQELVYMIGQIGANQKEVTKPVLAHIEPLLAKYTAAVRDWEFMVEHAAKTDGVISKDLFVPSSANWLSHKFMVDNNLIEESRKTRCQPQPREEGKTYLPGGQRRHVNSQREEERNRERRKKSWEAAWERFWTSLFGGVALIAPMVLMALQNDRNTALATTSVSVLLFAVIVAIFTRALPEVAVGAVSAYAAVLVVFVGSTLPQAA